MSQYVFLNSLRKSAMKRNLIFAFLLVLPGAFPALACECANPLLDSWTALSDYLTQQYGPTVQFDVNLEHRHSSLGAKLQYLFEGLPQINGANCWYKNDLNEPIYDCASTRTTTYHVTASSGFQTCRQSVTIWASSTRTSVRATRASCVATQ